MWLVYVYVDGWECHFNIVIDHFSLTPPHPTPDILGTILCCIKVKFEYVRRKFLGLWNHLKFTMWEIWGSVKNENEFVNYFMYSIL
jgi:hypothetical protein